MNFQLNFIGSKMRVENKLSFVKEECGLGKINSIKIILVKARCFDQLIQMIQPQY